MRLPSTLILNYTGISGKYRFGVFKMAHLYSEYGFDQRNLDINRLVRFGNDAEFFDNIDIVFRGILYEDVLEVFWFDGVNEYIRPCGRI